MANLNLFFLVNQRSGTGAVDTQAISQYCNDEGLTHTIFELPSNCEHNEIKDAIANADPQRVVAVGGDGTLKLAAENIMDKDIELAIIPAGSANGMAKELNIPIDFKKAMEVACKGKATPIHATKVNGQLCIHLADIGFNAYLVKKFDELPTRGMLTYAKAAWSAFWNHSKMWVELAMEGKSRQQKAAMVVIANATKYGTGLQINPAGKLNDQLFEVVLVKEYAVLEILKAWVRKSAFNPKKIEVLQTKHIKISSKHRAHFQIDGEYLGKTKQVEASIMPNAIKLVIP